jgi:hypothetical protein
VTAPTPARSIVWIASYPKSGNTWLRFLACNLVFGAVDSAGRLAELAPDVHELSGTCEINSPRVLMKTHFPYSKRLPLEPRTAAAIYVVRHPADVMLSNFHYARRRGADSRDGGGVLERYIDRYIAARGDPHWIELGMGSWEENVRSWMSAARGFPIMRVRYEDLLADGLRLARSLCEFLGIARSGADIERATAGASFERLRDIEEADIRAQRVGIFYKPYLRPGIEAGVRFMRAGRSGEGSAALTAQQRERFDTAFGALQRELGYLT